jgi:hypothetical protein
MVLKTGSCAKIFSMPRPLRGIGLTILLVCLVLLLFISQSVFAQESGQEVGSASLAPVETEEFPLVKAYLEARDAAGGFIYGLEAGDISIVEDGAELPVQELVMLRPGAKFVLAVGSGESLNVRDSQGKTRYAYLVEAIEKWAAARTGSTLDQLGFLPSGGSEVSDESDLDVWLASVKSYLMVPQEALPGFDVLGRALEVAADGGDRAGMGQGVLFITALPERDLSEEVQSMAGRANQRGVRIFIWLVGSADQFESPQASQLADLASLTGGSFFAFSGQEEIPDLEAYLEPLRSTYYLTYQSKINTSGVHQVSAVVKKGSFEASTPVQQFELSILPPTIAFVSPPTNIVRRVPAGLREAQTLMPQTQILDTFIEFPDGFPRSPARSILYVDGIPVEENTREPFHSFRWDLSEYAETGQHLIRAEVVDSLGQTSATAEIPVQITVNLPVVTRVTSLVSFSGNPAILAGFSILLAGSVLALVLILGGQLKPGALLQVRRRRLRSNPVTQPVSQKPEAAQGSQPRWMNRLHWPQRQIAAKPFASLVRVSAIDEGDTAPPIAITSPEVTFGSDPAEASIILTDLSVEPLHARLRREPDGSFWIEDCGSIAGTWVNFSPVAVAGTRLEHGDWIHLGLVRFQFQQKSHERIRKPVIHLEVPPL